MDEIIHALSPLLQALAIAVVGYLAKLVAQRWHVEIAESDERRLKELAQQGVLWAEEQARKAFADNGGVAPSSGAKREMAVQFVRRGAARRRLRAPRKMAQSDLHDLVEVELARLRDGAVDSELQVRTLPPPPPRA